MIRAFTDLTLDNGLALLYSAIASAVAFGVVVGVVVCWLSVAARGTDGS